MDAEKEYVCKFSELLLHGHFEGMEYCNLKQSLCECISGEGCPFAVFIECDTNSRGTFKLNPTRHIGTIQG